MAVATISLFSFVGSSRAEVVIETFKTGNEQRDLTLYLRRPANLAETDPVHGVLAICKYGDREIEMDLTGGSRHFGYLIDFADKNNLAVVAFGQPAKQGWDRTVSSADLSRRDAAEQDRRLDDMARDWSRIISRFARSHQLPEKDWLLYGICGGAQYAHRLALRQPQHFKAVHVHWGGSYDVPTAEGASLIWLVTSWADEPAYVAAQRFFQSCVEANYRIILKGHTRYRPIDGGLPDGSNPQAELSRRFFEFALTTSDPVKNGPEYLADYVNEMVLSAGQADWLPRKQAVWLPNRAIAEAWGPIED